MMSSLTKVNKKKILLFIPIIFLFLTGKSFSQEFNINSESHFVIDHTTGEIISKNNEHKKLPVASLTKIMTSYILFDHIKKNNISLDTIVPVSTNAVSTARRTNSARSFFEERHTITLDQIIKGLIIHSGNDAAIAVAEYVSGSEEAFATLMNTYAKSLNMENTIFANASGLPSNKTHYSTAYDMALLSRQLINDFEYFYNEYYSKKHFTYNDIFQQNRNRLLFIDHRFDGIKTGWTIESGYCFATSIIHKGRRFIITTLNAETPEDRFNDAQTLSNYAYANFSNMLLSKENSTIKGLSKIPLYKSNKLFVETYVDEKIIKTINNNNKDNIKVTINIPQFLIAPIHENEKVGEIIFTLNNKEINKIDVLSKHNYPIGNMKNYILDSFYLKFIQK